MNDSASPAAAIVTLSCAEQASRPIAGVAAVARIVRELAEAGFDEARLILPEGQALGKEAASDVDRLAGGMSVKIAAVEAEAALNRDALRLGGDRLVPAALLRGEPGPAPVDLEAPDAAAQILRRSGKDADGPVSRWLNRPISRRLTALLLAVPGIRPGHASAGTALLALLMFAALVAGGEAGLVAGAVLFHAASVFDGVDGEIARATFRSSRSGAVLDTVVDVATNLLFILGLTANVAMAGGGDRPILLAGWGFALFVLGLAAIAWRSARLEGSFNLDLVKRHYRGRFRGRLVPWLIAFATIVSSRDFYALLFMLLVIAGLPMAVLYLFATAATVWILFVLGSTRLPPGPPLTSRAV
jgi:CDP-L-myo-inositol myo-inositolphosphotransferase